MPNWFTALQVTATLDDDLVIVNSFEAIDGISEHDGLEIAEFNGRDIKSAYIEVGTGRVIIQLVKPWPHPTQTLKPAQAVPNAARFNEGVDALVNTKKTFANNVNNLALFGSQPTGTVTFSGVTANDDPVVIRSIPQFNVDITALEEQATDIVDIVTNIDNQVNGSGGLVEVVNTIDITLQGYKDSANADATKAQEYATKPYSLVITNTSDFSSLHYATDANQAKVIAVQAKADTESLKSAVELLKTNTGSIYDGCRSFRSTK
ncbi:MAG: hypothetical protein HRT38_18005 [Alteromonadaceae bacterium]|nr:hypothetical protein [Alteromonadaceae bacterium]